MRPHVPIPRKARERGALRLAGFSLWEKPDPAELLRLQAPYALRASNLLQHLALYYECALPLDTQVYCLVLCAFPLGSSEYVLEVIGTPALPSSPLDAPRVLMDRVEQPPFPSLIAWRRMVYAAERTFAFEVHWRPATGTRYQMAWPGTMPLEEAQTHQAAALRLLRAEERRGRPKDQSRYFSRDNFHAAWPAKLAEAQRRRQEEHVRDADMAMAYGVSLSTLRRYIKDYGRPPVPRAGTDPIY